MSDERIDIEVTDKVDKSVETKLRGIAAEAREGHSAVQKLKAALADIDSTPVRKLADASAKVTNALARELNAQARLTDATNRGAAADLKAEAAKSRLAAESAKAALAQQRLETETAKTQAATARATAATAQAAMATLRQEAALARQAAASDRASTAASQLESRTRALKASVDPLGAAFDRQNAELLEAQSLYARGAISATQFAKAEQVLTARINETVAAQQRLNATHVRGVAGSKAMTQATLNLSRQFADIGVTAAMGMNPLMILIQQGPQIADAFAQAKSQGLGFSAIMGNLRGVIGPMLPILAAIAAVVGIVAAGFGLLHRELSKGYPKDITDGLNLTAEQLDRVKSKTVTFGDTVAATFEVAGKHIMDGPVGDALRWLGKLFGVVMDIIVETVLNATATVIGLFVATFQTIKKHWSNMPAVFAGIAAAVANIWIEGFEKLVNSTIAGVNMMFGALNNLPGINLPTISPVSIARVKLASGSVAGQIQEDFAGAFDAAKANARAGMSAIGKEIGDAALARARKRALEEAGDPNKTGGGRKGAKDKEEWDRAGELANVNRELDNELKRMGMLKDAREVQNRLDQISQKFAEKGVPLVEAETEALRAKIAEIQRYTRVQAELDRMFEASTGPQRTYNAVLEASAKLQAEGAITAERYAFEIANAQRALAASKDLIGANDNLRMYEETLDRATFSLAEGGINQTQFNEAILKAAHAYRLANDPLAQYSDEIKDQTALLGLYGPALEKATYLQGIQNQLLAQGKSLYDASTGALTAEAQALASRFEALQNGLFVQQQMNALYQDVTANNMFLTNLAAMYAEVDRMRAADVVSEQEAARMRQQLQARYNEIRLENTRSMFSDLASLSSSGNQRLAAIGKAAAVAQATIDGYLAVQKALAAAPPPFNYVMAAAAGVKAAVQVAGIVGTNVGNFNEGGSFMVGGRDGVDRNLISMGVSKGERVTIETAAQQKAAAAAGNGSPDVNVPIKVVNLTDPKEAVAAMDSEEGERVILNTIRRNANGVKGMLQ